MKRPKLSSLLTVLLGWPAASTPAATILGGNVTTHLGPDFFFDTAATGGTALDLPGTHVGAVIKEAAPGGSDFDYAAGNTDFVFLGGFTNAPGRINTTSTTYQETSFDPQAFFRPATP